MLIESGLRRKLTMCAALSVATALCPLTISFAAPDDEKDTSTDAKQQADDTVEQSTVVRPFEDITVFPEQQRVEIRSWTCLEAGYLEQIACSPGTREHESLVVIRAKPSNIHASLLMAGFEAGRPGRWEFDYETQDLKLTPPRGDKIDVWFAYETDGERIVESARRWIRDHHEKQTFPDTPWIFGGSMFKPNPEWMGPGEHYVADMTGSIIGLVTFGDETIGLKEVISDQAAIHDPEWMVYTDRVPPEGTEVTVILLPYGQRPDGAKPAEASPDQDTEEASENDDDPDEKDRAVDDGK